MYPSPGPGDGQEKERGKSVEIAIAASTFLHAGASAHGTHGVQACGQLRVLLLNLQLGAGGLGVGDGVDDLGLGASKLGSPLKVFERLRDLALLEQQLGHSADGDVAIGVDWRELLGG